MIIRSLVYAALTDLNKFPEAQSPKDQLDRLLSLFSCFKKRKQNPVCHSGLRNDFAFALSGVYPGVKLMVDAGLFIQNMMSERLGLILDNFLKTDFETYLCILFDEFSLKRERHIALKEATTHAISGLREELINQFQEHGIPEESCVVIINQYLDSFDDIDIPYGSSTFMHALAGILKCQTKEKNPDAQNLALKITKQCIRKNFDLKNTEFTSAVIAFEKVNSTYQLLKQHQGMLSNWNNDTISQKDIEILSQFFASYYESCITNQAPQMISEHTLETLKNFTAIFDSYKKDARVQDIQNFFANWNAAQEEDDNDQTQQRALYANLMDPVFQSKFILPEGYLKVLEYAAEIEFTPYLINCFFLHAITVPPEKWSPLFFKFFSIVYKFVNSNEFEKNSDDSVKAHALKKGSYKPEFLQQLDYLQKYHQYIQAKKSGSDVNEPPSVPHYFPMLHLIRNKDEVLTLKKILPQKKWNSLLPSLDNKILKSLIGNLEFLSCVQECVDLYHLHAVLPLERWNNFAQSLDNVLLKKLLGQGYISDLICFKKILPPEIYNHFALSLDNEILKDHLTSSVSYDKHLLKDILALEGNPNKISPAEKLLCALKKYSIALSSLRYALPQEKYNNLAASLLAVSLDDTFFGEFKKNAGILVDCIEQASMESPEYPSLILMPLDNVIFMFLLKHTYIFYELLRLLTEKDRMCFLQKLGDFNFLSLTLNNDYNLIRICDLLPKNTHVILKKWSSIVRCKNIINRYILDNPSDDCAKTYSDEISAIINFDGRSVLNDDCAFNEARNIIFKLLNSGVKESLKQQILEPLIQNGAELINFIKILSKEKLYSALHSLVFVIAANIKTPTPFILIFEVLPEEMKIPILKKLGGFNFLNSILKNQADLILVRNVLPKEFHETLNNWHTIVSCIKTINLYLNENPSNSFSFWNNREKNTALAKMYLNKLLALENNGAFSQINKLVFELLNSDVEEPLKTSLCTIIGFSSQIEAKDRLRKPKKDQIYQIQTIDHSYNNDDAIHERRDKATDMPFHLLRGF